MKKILTIIVLLSICADISSAAYKSYWGRTTKSVSISKPYRSTSSSHTSQSDHVPPKKPLYYRAIPNHEPNVIVKKEDNFFWGMFWGAVLFSDHGKTTHVTNEIKQQVATENQDLWDEYQQNLEAIKSGDGDVDTLKARNKEILAIFKQKATEKYIAQFNIDAKEVSSVLLEEKNVTGVSGYSEPSLLAAMSGAERGAPIVTTQSFRRYTKTYQIVLTGPEKIDHFKASLNDSNTASIEQNASGLFIIYNQEFSDYSIGMQLVNKKDPSVVLSKSFDVGAGNILLQPLSSLSPAENLNKNIAAIFGIDSIDHLILALFDAFLVIGLLVYGFKALSNSSEQESETPMGYKETYNNTQPPTDTDGDQARTTVKTAKIRHQYSANTKYRAGR